MDITPVCKQNMTFREPRRSIEKREQIRATGVLIALVDGLEMPCDCLPHFHVAYVQQLCFLCAGWSTASSQ